MDNPRIRGQVEPRSVLDPYELQRLYLDDVLRFVSCFVKPLAEAEDVTMEVFQAAFKSLSKLRLHENPKLWILGIARRKVADSLRTRYRRRESPMEFVRERGSEIHTQIENSAVVNELLNDLPMDQREALILKYCHGLSTLEVADVLNRSEAATNSLLQRARAAFYSKGASLFTDSKEIENV